MTPSPTWIVLVHHLPSRPVRLRVQVWRRLQKLGAVAVKSSVYVLPWSDKTREDFEWLQQEIESGGGEAALFRAHAVAGATDTEIVAAFQGDRNAAYARLAADVDALSRKVESRRRGALAAPSDIDALEKEVELMKTELDRIGETDFFRAPGRAKASAALGRCRGLLASARGREKGPSARPEARQAAHDAARYQGRLWITRPRPHIDRCASAWLIRRFIDRKPRFGFAEEGGKARGGIPFDMLGAEFTHQGEDCTFETMIKRFGLESDTALRAVAEIVHDIDLKDGKYGRPEAAGVNMVLRGLSERIRDDQRLLRETEAVFDGLYATLSSRPPGGGKRAGRKRG